MLANYRYANHLLLHLVFLPRGTAVGRVFAWLVSILTYNRLVNKAIFLSFA